MICLLGTGEVYIIDSSENKEGKIVYSETVARYNYSQICDVNNDGIISDKTHTHIRICKVIEIT